MRSMLVLLAICVPGAAFGATVISDTHISFVYAPADPLGNVSLTVQQGAIGGDYTGVWFQFSPVDATEFSLQPKTSNLDEGSDWYLVEQGDAFTKQSIANGDFAPVLVANGTWDTVTVGSDFYLGVNTGGLPPDSRESIGWVHLQFVNNALTMVENVMAYNAPGIIVGTTTVVPEPSTVGLCLAGFAGLAALRSRK